MLFLSSFASVFLLSLSDSAYAATIQIRDSPVTLPLSRRINFEGLRDIVSHDVARAKFLRNSRASDTTLGSRAVVNSNIVNQVVSYTTSIGIGSPATNYELLIDTGSSNTWIGANQAYVKTKTSQETGDTISVAYGSGSFSGNEYIDTVTLTSELVLTGQSIGVATTTSGISFDGILGIGPTDLTVGTLSPSNTSSIPTVIDTAFGQGSISKHEIGVFFQPSSGSGNVGGELTYGGFDITKLALPLTFAPLTTTSPASDYWGIDQTIRYGDGLLSESTTILSSTAGIVDTGSTLVLIATDAFDTYTKATGGVLDSSTGLLRITTAQYEKLESLFFNINGVDFELTPNAQLWPRALNADIGGDADGLYLIVSDIGTKSGSGMDFINGFAFLERYYTLYDTANKRVGFAPTAYTFVESN